MSQSTAVKPTKFRHDYQPSEFLIDAVALEFDLTEDYCDVKARLHIERNAASPLATRELRLDGEDLLLLSIAVNGVELNAHEYRADQENLTILNTLDQFELTTVVRIHPQNNTRLEGLYKSSGNFCTQCEAEGFRRITYFLDRPDIMATYDVIIRADKKRYPYLLSNGNRVALRQLNDGRHEAQWHDPFKKPCYLFALVAGDLDRLHDSFVTASGRHVALEIYVDRGKLNQCHHAMQSVKYAMAWDEKVYGREYDLDVYMIVAVSDFNMGAMENKGLNIFNTKYVLANSYTATDVDYDDVESVIAHEYFHNWTGNRVTCRDWFQLSLKEGLTVFRDQQFSQDRGASSVKRIDDVRVIRTAQFSEDAGPMAHPIRPDSYVEMNNFYTVTVYNKGAEVIRMLHTIEGEDGFRRGMDLYFARHDGQAVTCDDFVQAHADANQMELTQFKRWYSQAGTPTVVVRDEFDASQQIYRLVLSQSTPTHHHNQPFYIPFVVGLLDKSGNELILPWRSGEHSGSTALLPLTQATQVFEFSPVKEKPLPSLLRGFSAPVKIQFDYTDEQLAFLMQHDRNDFNRWDAAQTLYSRMLMQLSRDVRDQKALNVPAIVITAMQTVINDAGLDNALRARLVQWPDVAYLSEQTDVIDIDALSAAFSFARPIVARSLYASLLSNYQRYQGNTELNGKGASDRAWSNACLFWLVASEQSEAFSVAEQQLKRAKTMTDIAAATRILAHSTAPQRQAALQYFASTYTDEALVMDKWFAMQASAPQSFALSEVMELLNHPAFDLRNPNKVRALLSGFAHNNPTEFHRNDGKGYEFIADQVMALNAINPQVAARLVGAFNRWRKFDDQRQQKMLLQLKRIAASQNVSADVYEIVSKSIGA